MSLLDRLITAERAIVPGSSYTNKSSSLFMRFLNFFVRLFNKSFMTDYVTTIGTKSYFPANLLEPAAESRALILECHEFVHKWDYYQHPLTQGIRYLFCRKYRRDSELRAYTMSMYVYWLRFGTKIDPSQYVQYFTSSDYFWMESNAAYVLQELKDRQAQFIEHEDQFLLPIDAEPYSLVKDFFSREGMIYGQAP